MMALASQHDPICCIGRKLVFATLLPHPEPSTTPPLHRASTPQLCSLFFASQLSSLSSIPPPLDSSGGIDVLLCHEDVLAETLKESPIELGFGIERRISPCSHLDTLRFCTLLHRISPSWVSTLSNATSQTRNSPHKDSVNLNHASQALPLHSTASSSSLYELIGHAKIQGTIPHDWFSARSVSDWFFEGPGPGLYSLAILNCPRGFGPMIFDESSSSSNNTSSLSSSSAQEIHNMHHLEAARSSSDSPPSPSANRPSNHHSMFVETQTISIRGFFANPMTSSSSSMTSSSSSQTSSSSSSTTPTLTISSPTSPMHHSSWTIGDSRSAFSIIYFVFASLWALLLSILLFNWIFFSCRYSHLNQQDHLPSVHVIIRLASAMFILFNLYSLLVEHDLRLHGHISFMGIINNPPCASPFDSTVTSNLNPLGPTHLNLESVSSSNKISQSSNYSTNLVSFQTTSNGQNSKLFLAAMISCSPSVPGLLSMVPQSTLVSPLLLNEFLDEIIEGEGGRRMWPAMQYLLTSFLPSLMFALSIALTCLSILYITRGGSITRPNGIEKWSKVKIGVTSALIGLSCLLALFSSSLSPISNTSFLFPLPSSSGPSWWSHLSHTRGLSPPPLSSFLLSLLSSLPFIWYLFFYITLIIVSKSSLSSLSTIIGHVARQESLLNRQLGNESNLEALNMVDNINRDNNNIVDMNTISTTDNTAPQHHEEGEDNPDELSPSSHSSHRNHIDPSQPSQSSTSSNSSNRDRSNHLPSFFLAQLQLPLRSKSETLRRIQGAVVMAFAASSLLIFMSPFFSTSKPWLFTLFAQSIPLCLLSFMSFLFLITEKSFPQLVQQNEIILKSNQSQHSPYEDLDSSDPTCLPSGAPSSLSSLFSSLFHWISSALSSIGTSSSPETRYTGLGSEEQVDFPLGDDTGRRSTLYSNGIDSSIDVNDENDDHIGIPLPPSPKHQQRVNTARSTTTSLTDSPSDDQKKKKKSSKGVQSIGAGSNSSLSSTFNLLERASRLAGPDGVLNDDAKNYLLQDMIDGDGSDQFDLKSHKPETVGGEESDDKSFEGSASISNTHSSSQSPSNESSSLVSSSSKWSLSSPKPTTLIVIFPPSITRSKVLKQENSASQPHPSHQAGVPNDLSSSETIPPPTSPNHQLHVPLHPKLAAKLKRSSPLPPSMISALEGSSTRSTTLFPSISHHPPVGEQNQNSASSQSSSVSLSPSPLPPPSTVSPSPSYSITPPRISIATLTIEAAGGRSLTSQNILDGSPVSSSLSNDPRDRSPPPHDHMSRLLSLPF